MSKNSKPSPEDGARAILCIGAWLVVLGALFLLGGLFLLDVASPE